MEYISSLTLSHFRSHKVSKLSLDGRPVVVFGNNGTGKTNILEAVSLFSPGRGIRRASAKDVTRNPEAIGWKIEGKVTNSISENENLKSSFSYVKEKNKDLHLIGLVSWNQCVSISNKSWNMRNEIIYIC